MERGETREPVPSDVFYVRKPVGENDYGRMDGICKLGYLACNGSKSAALYLQDHYGEDLPKNLDRKAKYACYAALAGDEDSRRWLKEQNRRIEDFYPEDVVLRGPFEGDRYCRGYICESGSEGVSDLRMDVRESDLIYGAYPYSYDCSPFTHGEWPWSDRMDSRLAGEPFSDYYRDTEDGRFCIDVLQYFGIGTERDEDSATRDLLDMAEGGSNMAMAMISYAIGYERDTMRLRIPLDPSEDAPRNDPMPFPVANGYMISNSPEWNLLLMFARTEPNGYCYDTEHENPDGGYEDNMLIIRPDDGYHYGIPTFVFKPSGYCMSWYKDAWRCPRQSENLTIGEILRVMRLCVEHLAYGREIPEGTTEELISMPMHLYQPPEDIADALLEMARRAPGNMIELDCAFCVSTYDDSHAEEAERMAREVIQRMGLRGPLHQEGAMSRRPGVEDVRQAYIRALEFCSPEQIEQRRETFRKAYGEDLFPEGDRDE